MTDKSKSKISILLISSNRLFREGIRRIFSGTNFTVVQESSSIEQALPLLAQSPPSLVLIDLHDVGHVLQEHLAELRASAPETRIVILTQAVHMNLLTDALLGGVDGYLLDDMSGDALQLSLNLVLLGEKVFPTGLAHLLTGGPIPPGRGADPLGHDNSLSDRETQILACLVNGASNKRIANELDISEGTVKVHLKSLLRKIHVKNRTQAAIWALNHGLASHTMIERRHRS
jgi:two-component system nitrate/nitrite response regulator NarL